MTDWFSALSLHSQAPSVGASKVSWSYRGPGLRIPDIDGIDKVLLPYATFLGLISLTRRLAAATTLGVDGPKLNDMARAGFPWRLEPRLREDQ